MPNTFPSISIPVGLSHFPAFTLENVLNKFLASANIKERTCSATELELEPTVLPISTFFFFASVTSMLSIPTPNLHTAFKLWATSKTSLSTLSTPTMIPSASIAFSLNCS